MKSVKTTFSNPEFRFWVYNVAAAALGVAAVHGLLSGDEAAAWLGLVSAILGMASSNVDRRRKRP